MCGIVGLIAPTIDQDRLLQANDLLAHRGPDDASVYVGEGVGLGARRLSIIDLQGGRQPLCNEDGTVWITYNGEVFNAPELRQHLECRGHRFVTLTDTEVIVHGYEEWGLDVVSRLRGMFAFGLWDTRRRRLVLARDRFGIKPLYYARVGGAFAFASEIRPLFTLLPALTPQTDLSTLAGLFEAGFIASPQTAFVSVNQLPPAHTLVLERDNITIAPYWQLAFPPDDQYAPLDIVSAAEQFAEKLRETVTTWRLSDVEVGSLLSGGIDSGMLAAMLTNSIQKPIHTFNIAFDAATHNESHQASVTAKHIQSIHNELNFSTSAFDLLPEVVAHLESPLCSATAVPIAMLYRACREAGFKVILTGEGADELLGGYHWYDGDRRIQPLLWLPRMLRKWLAALPLSISPSGRRVLREGTPNLASRFWLWQQVSTPDLRAELLKTAQPTGTRARVQPAVETLHPLNGFILLETQTRLPNFINLEVDRMSMMHSVEARPPFLDHQLWEFVAQLAPALKLASGHNKRILRQVAQDVLPAEVVNRPKKGLATPHAAWLRSTKLPSWAEEALHPASLTASGFFNPKVVARLQEEHTQYKQDHSRILMGILTTQLWEQLFL